jgi:crotonobetainyl-CoA:carnitine CoA-transferase CaiB-like acyl-CoA transferase
MTTIDNAGAWARAWESATPILAHDAAPPSAGPLVGLRIVDLSRLLPGPLATRHLADLGAEVLKVEPPQSNDGPGDDAARMGALGRDGISHFYRVINHGKRRVALDLKALEGLAQLRALVAEAHALVEGYRPGVMARLGLDYEALAGINPRITLTSISGYGQRGPLQGAAGHDINYLALAGVIDQTRAANRDPAICHLQIADLLGGAQGAATGTLAGIVGALLGGRGRWVDVSMTDAVRQHLVVVGADMLATGHNAESGSSLLDGGAPCYNLYRTRDGRWMAVGALELKFWRALCDALDRPDFGDRHWSRGEAPGSAAARACIGELATIFQTRDQAEWVRVFAEHDCCVTPVVDAYAALFGGSSAVPTDEALRRLTQPALVVREDGRAHP